MSATTSVLARLVSVARLAERVAVIPERRLERRRYDLWHAEAAGRAYDSICAADPRRRLGRGTRRRIATYARDVLGSRRFAPWLRVYAAWAGEFREGWIPDNYFGRVVMDRGVFTPGSMSQFKTVSRRILGTDLIPDVAYHVGGVWLGLDGERLEEGDVEGLVFSASECVVAKFDASSQGRGVHVLRSGRDSLRSLEGRGDFVVQQFLRQSRFFDRFTPDSVATLRITTVRTPDHPAHTRAHYLRLGRSKERTVVAASGVRVPIVDRGGRLGEVGALATWHPITEHPDSGATFSGASVPVFERACRTVEGLHDTVPQVEIIGWDVAITDREEIRIMEWNAGHPDIKFSEATIGPCFQGLGWEDRWRR